MKLARAALMKFFINRVCDNGIHYAGVLLRVYAKRTQIWRLGQYRAKVAKTFGPRYWQAIEKTSQCRFSSAVEQRFCKPKVGSSILSTGTNETPCFIGFFAT
jgi:hypothetical protein